MGRRLTPLATLATYNSWDEAEAALRLPPTQGWHNRTRRRQREKNGKKETEVWYGATYARLARRLRIGRPDRMAPAQDDGSDRIVFCVWLTEREREQVAEEAEHGRKAKGGRHGRP